MGVSLYSIEAWWIRKYINDFGKENVMNITIPPITFDDLLGKYYEVIEGQKKCEV